MLICHGSQPPRCPDAYVLDKFMFGILTGPELTVVGQHLLVCPQCQEKSETLERAISAFTEADRRRYLPH